MEVDAAGESVRKTANPNTEYPNRPAVTTRPRLTGCRLDEDEVKPETSPARSMSKTAIKPPLLTQVHAPTP